MTQNDFEAYKKAIKLKYEVEKTGLYSSFLLSPSRANLRKLCAERFKGNKASDDLTTYKMFFGFEFEEGNFNKLKNETDRFRAIENFLKGLTDTNDIEGINLAAILVDFVPRPYLKFAKIHSSTENENEINVITNPQRAISQKSVFIKGKKKRNVIIGLIGLTGLFSLGYTTKDLIFPKKQCMQWQENHYELLDCQSKVSSLYTTSPIIPIDEDIIELNKLKVCDTTTFFKGGKAIIWYCKVDGEPEYFDDSGFHPITGKTLKPVTDYIIKKYVK